MKVTKEGKVRLERGEKRFGNFFVRDEGENKPFKVTDLNSCFSIRISKRMPVGIWLWNIMKLGEKGDETIHTWISTVWALLSVAPDQEFVTDLIRAADANIVRHPDWYGGRVSATDEDDAEALEEVEGMHSFEEDVRKLEDE